MLPLTTAIAVVIICRLILQHWQDQSCFLWQPQLTLSALALSPACAPGDCISRESFMAYTSSVTSWYLQWLFIYCHIICTAQSPKGTSSGRMWGKTEQLQTFTGAKLNYPAIAVHSPQYERAWCKQKAWRRNAVFTEKHIFLCLCEGAVAWRMKCYCWVKAAHLSHGLTERSAWTWIFLEPQPCMNPKLSGERKGTNEVFVVRQSPLK